MGRTQEPVKVLLCAEGMVGREICSWLLDSHPQDLGMVVTVADNDIAALARDRGVPVMVYASDNAVCSYAEDLGCCFDWGFLAWWPWIIKEPLLSLPRQGFINTHPSFLPHNRGKHYNFWAIVEEAPYGASLHVVEPGIDCGDIVAQTRIPYDWEDTGESLYEKGTRELVRLFRETYPRIRKGEATRTPQPSGQGSFHLAEELESASSIELERRYRARDLLNQLRARTFPGHPACWFTDEQGREYEVRIEIKRRKS